MKNIVFLASDLHIEYCLTILNGVFDFFKKVDDTHLIVAQVKSKDDSDGTFTFQSSMAIDMIRSKDIDGYILLSTSFGGFLNNLVSLIREKNSSPIISIGVEMAVENCYSTKCNTTEIYKEIVGHLIEKHNCKKIGFFSANESQSQEAQERFESYKDALNFFDIEYNPDYVLHGNFTRYRTKQIIGEKYKVKDEIPFDSIICANDLTASGCVEAFSDLGVSIPDELKIIGFDDSFQTAFSEPSISSVNQQIEQQGYNASKLIYEKLQGKEIEKLNEVYLEPVYRQSCGCINLSSTVGLYKNRKGELINKHENYINFVKSYYDRMSDNRSIYVIFDFLHSNETLDFLYKNIDAIRIHTGFIGISICLYKKTIEHKYGDDFELPEEMQLGFIYDKTNNLRKQNSYTYNPSEKLLPKELDSIPGFFILEPIFNCEKTYGYFIARFEEQKLEAYSIHAKIFSQGIAQAAELSLSLERNHLLELEKDNLAKQSRTDELTKILNRRGFLEYGQQQINLSISMDTTGAIFFADLDGLKKINDTYGHKMGDQAIQLASQALKASFRKADIVGRLSGDEFAVVANDMSIKLLKRTRKKLDEACKKLQKENNLPYTLSISLGGVEYSEESYYLKDLLIKADENLYEEKKRHHERLAAKD